MWKSTNLGSAESGGARGSGASRDTNHCESTPLFPPLLPWATTERLSGYIMKLAINDEYGINILAHFSIVGKTQKPQH